MAPPDDWPRDVIVRQYNMRDRFPGSFKPWTLRPDPAGHRGLRLWTPREILEDVLSLTGAALDKPWRIEAGVELVEAAADLRVTGRLPDAARGALGDLAPAARLVVGDVISVGVGNGQ